MFVDASAIVAMLADPNKARRLAAALEAAANRMTAAPCVVEAVERLARATGAAPADVLALVERFLDAMGVRVVSLPAALAGPAATLMGRFAQDGGPAGGLDAGRCLVLAAARYYRLDLLHDDPALADAAG